MTPKFRKNSAAGAIVDHDVKGVVDQSLYNKLFHQKFYDSPPC